MKVICVRVCVGLGLGDNGTSLYVVHTNSTCYDDVFVLYFNFPHMRLCMYRWTTGCTRRSKACDRRGQPDHAWWPTDRSRLVM